MMNKKEKIILVNEITFERLAALEHEQWAHWTRYMLDNLSPENIKRWTRQIETPYYDLTEEEKNSDREWAVKVMAQLDHKAVPMTEDPICHQCMIYKFRCPECGHIWVDDAHISKCEKCSTRVNINGEVP